MSESKPCPSDLTDVQWSFVESVLTAWRGRRRSVSGHQGVYSMREIVNAILHRGRTGCRWACLPHGLSPRSATYYWFAVRRDDGTGRVVHELLCCQVRERVRRSEDPALVVPDTLGVHAAAGVPASTAGRGPVKRVPGRRRALAVDVLGPVVAVIVRAANTHGSAADAALLDHVVEDTGGSVRKAPVGQGFKEQVAAHGGLVGIDVENVERNPHRAGFVPQPKRRRADQTCGILLPHRRPVRDCEHRPASAASRAHRATTQVMARRLTGANTSARRDPKVVTA
ncbi:transposase [Kitasatospora sp. NPDC092948]|uniref:transposase n=1 Tax=Kitasatospora sp. NPDC092948 TaxID=3364088 RepID=UPI0038206962